MMPAYERKMLYAFLANLFSPPEAETMQLLSGIEEATFATLFPDLPMPPAVTLEELQTAYDQLFAGRGGDVPVSLFGSAYLETKGASTLLVSQEYRSLGLDPEQSDLAADYLPTELEYLFLLTQGEEAAAEDDDRDEMMRWLMVQAEFFGRLFMPWIEPFCERIRSVDAAHPFYLWAAQLLQSFVTQEQHRLQNVPAN